MKFLIDQPVSPLLARWLRENGHDAAHVRERDMLRCSDEEIVEVAFVESRIPISTDLDYSRIIALSRKDGPALIQFRAGNVTDAQMLKLLQDVLRQVEPERLEKSIVVTTGDVIRIATLPIK